MTHAAILFDLEDGGVIFIQNIGLLSPGYTASHPRRQNCS
jgi:hypothetical protein